MYGTVHLRAAHEHCEVRIDTCVVLGHGVAATYFVCETIRER